MLSAREQFISICSNDRVGASDVIVLLEGDGTNRLAKAASLFHSGLAPKICFSGGAINEPYGSLPFEYYKPLLSGFNLQEDDFVLETKSLHTQQQAVEVLNLADKNNWKKILLVASHYHQYRAYLTFLKEILNRGTETILINAPASDLPWFNSNTWGRRVELLIQEFEKIERYISSGHCATYEEAINYQQWKESRLLTK